MVRVSVVIPVYNRASLLPRAVASVLAQTYKDIEVVIVNDGSTDETEKVVERLSDSRIKYICHNDNKGVSADRNTGVLHSHGE